MTRHSWFVCLLLPACGILPGDFPEHGSALVCLEGVPESTNDSGAIAYDVTLVGTVKAIRPTKSFDGCSDSPVAIAFTDSVSDDDYVLGLALTTADGVSVVDPVIPVGSTVEVDYEELGGFAKELSLLVNVDGAPNIVVNGGLPIDESSLPGLTVASGDRYASHQTDCGKEEAYETVFTCDGTSITVRIGESGPIACGGSSYEAWVLDNSSYPASSCPDVGGGMLWALVRK